MASAHLKQRMEHIMRYSNSSARAFWHFAVTSVAVVFLFAAVAASAAISNSSINGSDAYTIKLRVGKIGTDLYAIQAAAHETKTNVLAWAPRPIKVKAGESFEASGGTAIAGEPELSFHLAGRLDAAGRADARVDVMRGTEVVQRTTVAGAPTDEGRYTGERISMQLKNADIRDVLSTFGKLTGLEIVPDADVTGKVDVDFTDVPWDQAFDEILKDHGYTWRMQGKKLLVSRM
jgi:hypothetical protein